TQTSRSRILERAQRRSRVDRHGTTRRNVLGGLLGCLIAGVVSLLPLTLFLGMASGLAQGPRASSEQFASTVAIAVAFVAFQGAVIGAVVAATGPTHPRNGSARSNAGQRGFLAGATVGAVCPGLCYIALTSLLFAGPVTIPLREVLSGTLNLL